MLNPPISMEPTRTDQTRVTLDAGLAAARILNRPSAVRVDVRPVKMDFSTNHECGLLSAGHELMAQILENWHHPYYRELLEQQGFSKAMDLYKWEIMSADRGLLLPAIEELADRLQPEHGIRLHRMRKRDFAREVKAFMEVYNLAWSHNWGFVPLTDAELEHMAKE